MEHYEDFELGSFPRIDRVPARVKRGDFWKGLELVASGAASMRDWEWAFGSAMDLVRPFLRATGKRADVIACPAAMPCECQHVVRETEMNGLVAACCCESWQCETYRIDPEDVMIWALDRGLFGGEVARALGFGPVAGVRHQSVGLFEMGRCVTAAAPVYLGMGDSDALLREVGKVVLVRDGPFLLLTPTGKACGVQVEQALLQHGAGHLAMGHLLECGVPGTFRMKPGADVMLEALARRLGGGDGLATTVERIGRDLEAIAKGNFELRKENSEFRRWQSEGLFRFALRVEAQDFQAFAAVMALGNRKAAAEFLGVPLRSFYDRVERWPGRGGDYARMFRIVEWRKATDRKTVVRLEESVASGVATGRAENPTTVAAVLDMLRDRDGGGQQEVLRQVLGALQAQNGGNWVGVRDELVGILREEVPQ